MPTIFTHAIAAASLGPWVVPHHRRGRLLAIGALCAVLPDADVIAFRLDLPYDHMLGHRGLSHSIAFALALAVVVTVLVTARQPSAGRMRVGAFLFVATVSHGCLDALTDGGLGVAFFAPFSSERFFFPWRPIVVSPISIRQFFSSWGLAVIESELIYVWIPAAMVAVAGLLWQRRRAGGAESAS
jgi:inner membrane protein